MFARKKKPGAKLRPGKDKTRSHVTRKQADVHRAIAWEACRCQANSRPWRPYEYPTLYALLQAALANARSRQYMGRRMSFTFEGKRYAMRPEGLGRLVVADHVTGRFLASSTFFAI